MRSPDDWTLSYPGVSLQFGSIASKLVFSTAPDIGPVDINTDDAERPRGDGTMFGLDYFGGRTLSFDVLVNGDDEADAAALLAELTQAWRGDVVRSTPGATATLQSGNGRLVFGRPRRFAPDLALLPYGAAQAIFDFAAADSIWYSDTENAVLVSLVPAPSGGLMAPLVAPLSTTQSSDRSQGLTVGGEMKTWPVFEIKGPIINPVIEIVGRLKMQFTITLAYDETLVIDTRPWARSILRNGASVAGCISRQSTRLSNAALDPGRYEIVLRGRTAVGSPTLNTRWRSAFATP